MPTTVVYPSLDVSGTASISTIVGTAATFAGSVTASTLAVTGTATFSGTAVFAGTLQALASATFSATVAFLSGATGISLDQLNSVSLSTPLSDGQVLKWNGAADQWINDTGGGAVSATLTVTTLTVSSSATFGGHVLFQGTVSFSATVFFSDLSITTLGVTGTASFAGQVNFGATASFSDKGITFNGFPMGMTQLGSISIATNATSIRFSGSWSDYGILVVHAIVRTSGTSNTGSIAVYTDGGTTSVLGVSQGSLSAGAPMYLQCTFYNGTAFKAIYSQAHDGASGGTRFTATANTGILNAFQFRASATMSGGFALLYGQRGR